MPWHAEIAPGTDLTKEVFSAFDKFDKEGSRVGGTRHGKLIKPTSVGERRKELQKTLGTSIDTAHAAAGWTKDEADAVTSVFMRFIPHSTEGGNNKTIDFSDLKNALRLLGLNSDSIAVRNRR